MTDPISLPQRFLRFALECEVLRFGRFKTKAGRESPYFFNAGLFHSGSKLDRLGQFYADVIHTSKIECDMLFGPAYKGIPLSAVTASALSRNHHRDLPVAFNRKEAKDHGEGGRMIGAPLSGRVLIIDDVISAGTSVAESAQWIREAGASLAGVVISLDRQERGTHTDLSATRQVEQTLGVPVLAIATLSDLIMLLEGDAAFTQPLQEILHYRAVYGA